MRHVVVGTAGHIDHGKSALVKALTGTDPDRLEEEKRRGMTIDLGFAHLDLPSGRRVGIVDVPGHERLIKNMLAGATGIDLVLLVIAADEGVMPQTREHLDILRFLPVRRGIVVLNKIDLVQDPDWLILVKDDVKALTLGTFLEGAPVAEVSAKTGQGVPELIHTMDRILDVAPAREINAPARLPVDRAFVMTGFGTVVTGTLWSGRMVPGEVLELLPQGTPVRVRGIQVHGQEAQEALAGSRVALNLVGVEKEEVRRGDVLCVPRTFQPTTLIDVRVRLLPTAPPQTHLARVRLYIGADEAIGRLMLLDRPRLKPADEAVGQIRLEKPIVAAAKDPIVLRRYSPMVTIGGGEVITPHPPKRRRNPASVLEIEQASTAGLDDRVEAVLREVGKAGTTAEELMRRLAVAKVQADEALAGLNAVARVIQIRGRLFHASTGEAIAAAVGQAITDHHRTIPWRLGMPKEELKAKTFGTGDDRLYAHVLDRLVRENVVEEAGGFIRRPGYTPAVEPEEAKIREQIVAGLRSGRFAPPSREELAKQVANAKTFDRMFQSLLDEGAVVEVAPGIFFHTDVLEEIKQIVAAHIAANGSITVAALRDRLGTSRKFSLTVLEYLDTMKVTRRVGDLRVLTERPPVGGLRNA